MTVDELVDLLVDEMRADNSPQLGEQILADAKKKFLGGKGSVTEITAASANGKSFTRQINISCTTLIRACRLALDIYTTGKDDSVASTRADFRNIDR